MYLYFHSLHHQHYPATKNLPTEEQHIQRNLQSCNLFYNSSLKYMQQHTIYRLPETVKNRLNVYHEQTQPLIDYYTGKKVLHEVDGTKEMEAVFGDIVSILGE